MSRAGAGAGAAAAPAPARRAELLQRAHERMLANWAALLTGPSKPEIFARAFPAAAERYPGGAADARGLLAAAFDAEFAPLARAAPHVPPLLVADVIRNWAAATRADIADMLRTAVVEDRQPPPSATTVTADEQAKQIAELNELLVHVHHVLDEISYLKEAMYVPKHASRVKGFEKGSERET
jgi:hypothetical protein